jgi:hypothetical protein
MKRTALIFRDDTGGCDAGVPARFGQTMAPESEQEHQKPLRAVALIRDYTPTVTRKKVAGMEVVFSSGLLF